MNELETYILSNYLDSDFPQKYQSYLKEKFKEPIQESILGDDKLTEVTNNIINNEPEIDYSYLDSFRNYTEDSVQSPEVDFLKSLALEARYIDDNEYLEWLNDDKMAKILAEYPTRGDLIDHMGSTLGDIVNKYGNDPNIELLIKNMTYKSHPLAFYEFSEHNDFSFDPGDFGFRQWARNGINAVKRLFTQFKEDNEVKLPDNSSRDDSRFTDQDLKDMIQTGTKEQKELASSLLRERWIAKASSSLPVGIITGEVPAVVSREIKNVTEFPANVVRHGRMVAGASHDPSIPLMGQVRNSWDYSTESGNEESQVIKNMKDKVDSGELKLSESSKSSNLGEIPMGPAKDNKLVNSGLKQKPNEFSKSNLIYKTRQYMMSKDFAKTKTPNWDKVLGNEINEAIYRLKSDLVKNPTLDKYTKKRMRKQIGELESMQYDNTPVSFYLPNNNDNNKSNLDKMMPLLGVGGVALAASLLSPKENDADKIKLLELENENMKLKNRSNNFRKFDYDYSIGEDFGIKDLYTTKVSPKLEQLKYDALRNKLNKTSENASKYGDSYGNALKEYENAQVKNATWNESGGSQGGLLEDLVGRSYANDVPRLKSKLDKSEAKVNEYDRKLAQIRELVENQRGRLESSKNRANAFNNLNFSTSKDFEGETDPKEEEKKDDPIPPENTQTDTHGGTKESDNTVHSFQPETNKESDIGKEADNKESDIGKESETSSQSKLEIARKRAKELEDWGEIDEIVHKYGHKIEKGEVVPISQKDPNTVTKNTKYGFKTRSGLNEWINQQGLNLKRSERKQLWNESRQRNTDIARAKLGLPQSSSSKGSNSNGKTLGDAVTEIFNGISKRQSGPGAFFKGVADTVGGITKTGLDAFVKLAQSPVRVINV